MTHRDQNQLLREILSGNEVLDFRRASLDKGLIMIQTQRKRRKMARALALTCLALLFPTAFLLIERSSWHQPQETALRSPQIGTVVRPHHNLEMKYISDEELFKLFPGRSIALIGKPGEQELIFLDKQSEAVQ
jgi:hypothetical protein